MVFKIQYQPTDDNFFSKFFPSDAAYCPADVFVNLTSNGDIDSVTIQTSCPALKLGGLYIPGNSLKHTIHIPLNDATQPTTVHSEIATGDSIVINEFLVIRQPESGWVADIAFYPNGMIVGGIQDCVFSLFEKVFTTSLAVMSNEQVTFTVPQISLFGLLDVSLHGLVRSGVQEGDVEVLVTADLPKDSVFVHDMQSSIEEHFEKELENVEARLEINQNSKQGVKNLFDHYYQVLQEKLSVLENVTESHKSSLKEVELSTSIVEQYQVVVDALGNETIFAVCSVQSCEESCGVSHSCRTSETNNLVDEWGVGPVIELDNLTQNVEVEVDEYDWMLEYFCSIITNIKSWGEARLGQRCSHRSTYDNRHLLKWVAEQKEANVSHSRPIVEDIHELMLKRTKLTDDLCGMEVDHSQCVLSNAACRIAQTLAIDSLPYQEQIQYKVVGELNEALKNLSIAKSESSLEYYKWKIAQHNVIIHQELLQELANLLEYYDQFYDILHKTNEGLLEIKFQLGENDSLNSVFEITSMDFATRVEDFSSTEFPVIIRYNIPLLNESSSRTIMVDLHSPIEILQRDIATAVIKDLNHQFTGSGSNNTKLDSTAAAGISPTGLNQQRFEHYCALIDSIKYYLLELNQTYTDSNTLSANVKASIDGIIYDTVGEPTVDLATVVDFEILQDHFGVSITANHLMTQAKQEGDYLKRKDIIGEAESLESSISSIVDETEYLSWFIATSQVHNISLLDSIGGELCFGFADCLKLVGILLNRINDDTPASDYGIKNDVMKTAEDLLYSIALYQTTNTTYNSLDVWQFIDPIYHITLQFESSDYWCIPLPLITTHPEDHVYAPISSNVTLQCGPEFSYNYAWYKDGFSLDYHSAKLPFDSVSLHDEGQYQCVASNIAGKTYSSFSQLHVVEDPQVTLHPANVSAFEGSEDDALFKCNATGNPSPEYAWYYSYNKLNWVMVFNTSNEYTVYKPTKQSEGWYRCSASVLDVMEYSDAAYLTVIGASISQVSFYISFDMLLYQSVAGALATTDMTKLPNIIEETVRKDEVWNYGYLEQLVTEMSDPTGERMSVSFRLTTAYEYSLVETLLNQAREAAAYKNELDGIVSRIKKKLEEGACAMHFEVDGTEYLTIPSSFIVSEEFFRCPAGQSLAYNGFICCKSQKQYSSKIDSSFRLGKTFMHVSTIAENAFYAFI